MAEQAAHNRLVEGLLRKKPSTGESFRAYFCLSKSIFFLLRWSCLAYWTGKMFLPQWWSRRLLTSWLRVYWGRNPAQANPSRPISYLPKPYFSISRKMAHRRPVVQWRSRRLITSWLRVYWGRNPAQANPSGPIFVLWRHITLYPRSNLWIVKFAFSSLPICNFLSSR